MRVLPQPLRSSSKPRAIVRSRPSPCPRSNQVCSQCVKSVTVHSDDRPKHVDSFTTNPTATHTVQSKKMAGSSGSRFLKVMWKHQVYSRLLSAVCAIGHANHSSPWIGHIILLLALPTCPRDHNQLKSNMNQPIERVRDHDLPVLLIGQNPAQPRLPAQ